LRVYASPLLISFPKRSRKLGIKVNAKKPTV
jgi:hypothetical protein